MEQIYGSGFSDKCMDPLGYNSEYNSRLIRICIRLDSYSLLVQLIRP